MAGIMLVVGLWELWELTGRGYRGSCETGKQANQRSLLHKRRQAQVGSGGQERRRNKRENKRERHNSPTEQLTRSRQRQQQVRQTKRMHKPSGTDAFQACRDAGWSAAAAAASKGSKGSCETGKQANQRSLLHKQRQVQVGGGGQERRKNKRERHNSPTEQLITRSSWR